MKQGLRKLKRKAELMEATKDGSSRTEAREMGVSIGKYVRYKDTDGPEHFGTIVSTHVRSVVVELTAEKLINGGENILIRSDEIPYKNVLEVLGERPIVARIPPEKPSLPMAPDREGGYTQCDYCDGRIFEVIATKTGLKALCRDHARVSEDESEEPTFKFRLGLILYTYKNWPRPKDSEVSETVETVAMEPGKCQCGGKLRHRGRHKKKIQLRQESQSDLAMQCWCGGKLKHRGRHRKKSITEQEEPGLDEHDDGMTDPNPETFYRESGND